MIFVKPFPAVDFFLFFRRQKKILLLILAERSLRWSRMIRKGLPIPRSKTKAPTLAPASSRRFGFEMHRKWSYFVNASKRFCSSFHLLRRNPIYKLFCTCQTKDALKKFMDSIISKTGKLRSLIRELEEKFDDPAAASHTPQIPTSQSNFYLPLFSNQDT